MWRRSRQAENEFYLLNSMAYNAVTTVKGSMAIPLGIALNE
jgi:hypothetical protein